MFSLVVELYRAAGRPEANGSFSYDGQKSPRISDAISVCKRLDIVFGHFERIEEREDGGISFTWRLAANASANFFADVAMLVNKMQSIHRGKMPENFYLTSNDYAFGEPNPPEKLLRLESICELINHIETLSDQVNEAANKAVPLSIFISLPGHRGMPPQAAKLTTRIPVSVLDGKPLVLDDLRVIVDPNLRHTTHYLEKQALFRMSIAHFLVEQPSSRLFKIVVDKWSDIVRKFRYDTECYVAQYSFENFTEKLAETQSDFAARLTKVMGDTATKFLALPLPFIALIGIAKSDGIGQAYLVFIGATVLALLYAAQVRNQFLELGRIEHSFDLVFARLKPDANGTPIVEGASQSLLDVQGGFNEQRCLLRRTLRILLLIAWLPIAGGLGMLAYIYHPAFYRVCHKALQWFDSAVISAFY